ncbi:MAG: hypothetical protein Q7S63_00205, partial [bacterium]|nr:hypothetical protein [bacterium]
FVLNLFTELGFHVLERSKVMEIAWIAQRETKFVLQFIESEQHPLPTETKIFTHIAFITEDPKKEIERIKQWIQSQDVTVVDGKWTDKEFWLDCPEVFIDFVLEIMHTSVVE